MIRDEELRNTFDYSEGQKAAAHRMRVGLLRQIMLVQWMLQHFWICWTKMRLLLQKEMHMSRFRH